MNKIADQLRAVIKDRDLTPTSVARLADLDPSVVTRFVNAERDLSLESFGKVTAALGLFLAQGSQPKKRPAKSSTKGRAKTRSHA